MPRVLVDLLSYTGTKGGMETYTRDLYRALGALEDDYEYIGLLSTEGAKLDQTWFPGRIIESGISGEDRVRWAWGELTQVARFANREGVDLVHSPATLGPRKTRMPTVVTMHDMLYWSHPEYMSTPLYTGPVKWMEKVAARNAARVITISPSSAAEIVKYLDVPGDRLAVIPLAGDPPHGVDRTQAREDDPVILAMGNRRPHKNWGALIRALAHIPPERRPRVIITGGRGDDPLASVVADTGMQEHVELRGWVDDAEVTELYSRATALAIPSLAEGFSLPTLEAMAAGIPVLLSDIDVHHFVGGDAAVYFDPRDDRSVAGAMDAITHDADLRARLTAAGPARAAEFTWARTARETRAVFDDVLGLSR